MTRLRAKQRLRNHSEISLLFRQGSFTNIGPILVKYKANTYGHSRVLISLNSRYGSAVKRNRTRRLIKEVWRTQPEASCLPWDVIFFSLKRPARPLDYPMAKTLVKNLCQELHQKKPTTS